MSTTTLRKLIKIYLLALLLNLVRNAKFGDENFTKCREYYHNMNDFKCYREEGHDLPLVENLDENSIFFIHSSCKRSLTYREACSVESAAKLHPLRNVNVLFVGPVTQTCLDQDPFATLDAYENINYHRVHAESYCMGTPFRNIFKSKIFKHSKYRALHAANILRMVTLLKYGGIYLDFDMIVTKSFDSLPSHRNFIGKATNYSLGTAVMGLSKRGVGKIISQILTEILKNDFDEDSWTPKYISDVTKVALENVCSTTDLSKMSAANCRGLGVYPPKFFYSVPATSWIKLFSNHIMNLKQVYAVHTWNQLSHSHRINKSSYYAFLMKSFCPAIYNTYNNRPKNQKRSSSYFDNTERNLNIVETILNTEMHAMHKRRKTRIVRPKKVATYVKKKLKATTEKELHNTNLKLIDEFLQRKKYGPNNKVFGEYWVLIEE